VKPNAGTYQNVKDKSPIFSDTNEPITLKLDINVGIRTTFTTSETLNPDFANLLPIKVKWTHPPLFNPETNKQYRSPAYWSSLYFTKNKRTTAPGYNMTNAWEMASGQWTVELFCDGQVVTNHSFELVE
jgi:hypothetical protein